MKKFFVLIFICIVFFNINLIANAYDFYSYCISKPDVNPNFVSNSKIDFLNKKIVEFAISKDLNREFESNFNVKLNIYNIKRLKNGEFKNLIITTPYLHYQGMSISNFYAATLCSYNKVIYKNGRVYYPQPMPVAFTAEITNDDLEYILESKEFNDKFLKNSLSINANNLFQILKPKFIIKDSNVYLDVPIKTIFSNKPINIHLVADVEVVNNSIILKNISFSKNSNIMFIDIKEYFVKNPISITNSLLNGKFCNIYITKAKIMDDVIKSEGILLINKNYGGEYE